MAGPQLFVDDPTKSDTAGIDQNVQASTVQKLGIGNNNPRVYTDPTTGALSVQAQSPTPTNRTNTFRGADGNFYHKDPLGRWSQLKLDANGVTTGGEFVEAHDQRLKGLQAIPKEGYPATGATTDLHATDPGWQIQQGVLDAANLDPAKNAALRAASEGADRFASGAVGDQLAAETNPYLQATQKRLDAQASDLGIVRDSAMGRGPSAAENLARAQLDANIRSQSAMAATARGGNIAAAMRQASNSGTQQSLQSAATIAAQRAQEQLNAQGLLTTGANNLTGAQGRFGDQGAGLALTRSQLLQAGQGMQAGVAAETANDTANWNAHKQQAAAKYAEYLMNLYQISSGNNVSYSGQGVQAGIANVGTTKDIIGGGYKAVAGGAAGLV